ncbi:hypothetical Protein YC6258_01465 [Gynuella sunshinyii YC6258]|uniref:Uncharacterized protein n=1 Tax=Gynuella sunshinyii YC6258 TaxID=1445510 RepID=A0A0C5VJD5_9GAMM|nr:hypothetical Protein YC6258_01465 [Gynuella sunshinyii YC6258]
MFHIVIEFSSVVCKKNRQLMVLVSGEALCRVLRSLGIRLASYWNY